MPKIKNWTRRNRNSIPSGFWKMWENDVTGEKVAITEKIPDEGYYVLRFKKGELVKKSLGERIGHNNRKDRVSSVATDKLRENPHGWEN